MKVEEEEEEEEGDEREERQGQGDQLGHPALMSDDSGPGGFLLSN